MGYYEKATICINGHVMSSYHQNSQPYCSVCGKETISNCPSCNAPIHGKYHVDGIYTVSGTLKPDYYCYACGKPYPWTQKILDSAVELLSLDENIDEDTQQLLKESFPNLIVSTPSTPVAIARYNNFFSKTTKVVKDSMHQLLVDVISESVRKILFPQ